MTLVFKLEMDGDYWCASGDPMLCAEWTDKHTDLGDRVHELHLVLTNEDPRDPQRSVHLCDVYRVFGEAYVTVDRGRTPVHITMFLAEQIERFGNNVWAWLEAIDE